MPDHEGHYPNMGYAPIEDDHATKPTTGNLEQSNKSKTGPAKLRQMLVIGKARGEKNKRWAEIISKPKF